MNKEWWSKNWDKVLGTFSLVVVSGLIGYFSALRVVDSRLAALGERVATNEGAIHPDQR